MFLHLPKPVALMPHTQFLLSLLLWVTESELMQLASLSNTDQRYLLHLVLFTLIINPETISPEQAEVGRIWMEVFFKY